VDAPLGLTVDPAQHGFDLHGILALEGSEGDLERPRDPPARRVVERRPLLGATLGGGPAGAAHELMKAFEREGDYQARRYQQLHTEHLYKQPICRLEPWPAAVQRCMDHLAMPGYGTMQGPNEFVVTGTFKDWDRWDALARITVPTLPVVGRHDTMCVEDVEEMGRRMPNARVHVCENGSHTPFRDDAEDYFEALRRFIRDVEGGSFR